MTISRNLSIFAANVTSTGTYSQFASGTLMLFQQSTAPTGWTKQTTHDNKALRVVSGSASSGGSSTFTTVFADQTPTITTSGLSAGATTLSLSQTPSHNHYLAYLLSGSSGPCGAVAGNYTYRGTQCSDAVGSYVYPNGGGGSHTHTISGSATSSAVTLNVAYVDLIIASKA